MTTTRQRSPSVVLDDATWAAAGQRVRAYRLAHGLKHGARRYLMPQDALAKRAGVSPGCLRGFENGTRRTTRVKLERIAAACGMTFDILTASATAPPPAAADPVQTDETAAIACLFGWAHTGARMRVIAVLREHYAQRTDPNPAPVAFALGFIAGLRPSTTIAEPVPAGDPVTLATVIGQLATITDAATLREILAVIARDSVRVG